MGRDTKKKSSKSDKSTTAPASATGSLVTAPSSAENPMESALESSVNEMKVSWLIVCGVGVVVCSYCKWYGQ